MAQIDYSKLSANELTRIAAELSQRQREAYEQSINAALAAQEADYQGQIGAARRQATDAGAALRAEYERFINPYGVAGENRADAGLGGSGLGEVLGAGAYAQYLTQRSRAAQSLQDQVAAYNRSIATARTGAAQDIGKQAAQTYASQYDALLAGYKLYLQEQEQARKDAESAAKAALEAQKAAGKKTVASKAKAKAPAATAQPAASSPLSSSKAAQAQRESIYKQYYDYALNPATAYWRV